MKPWVVPGKLLKKAKDKKYRARRRPVCSWICIIYFMVLLLIRNFGTVHSSAKLKSFHGVKLRVRRVWWWQWSVSHTSSTVAFKVLIYMLIDILFVSKFQTYRYDQEARWTIQWQRKERWMAQKPRYGSPLLSEPPLDAAQWCINPSWKRKYYFFFKLLLSVCSNK